MEIIWPKGYVCAVLLTFDFDAESDELRTDQKKMGPIIRGRYGANVGLNRIFDVLESFSVPATFFVPGWVVENYTEKIKDILERGYEVAAHGYMHEKASELSKEQEKEMLEKCSNSFKRIIGIHAEGYRAPWFDMSPSTLTLLSENGFTYDSSLMDQDLPYLISLNNNSLVELPVSWILDDYPAFEVAMKTPKEVKETWQATFDSIYSQHLLFNLTMHPECIARPGRIEILKELISYISNKKDVWFAKASEVAKLVLQKR